MGEEGEKEREKCEKKMEREFHQNKGKISKIDKRDRGEEGEMRKWKKSGRIMTELSHVHIHEYITQ